MFNQIGRNDAAFLGAVLFFCTDMWVGWDAFSTCSAPIHTWLFMSLVCAILFRAVRLLATVTGETNMIPPVIGDPRPIGGNLGHLLLDLGHKGPMARVLTKFVWSVAVPFFTLWNFIGTMWLWKVVKETPDCVPSDTYIWFSVLWLFLCYYWLFVHTALAVKAALLKHRVQRTEDNLREIEQDVDVQMRWGPVSRLSVENTLVDEAASSGKGLSAAEIRALPSATAEQLLVGGRSECSICLLEIEPDVSARCLPGCKHVFHRSCIDLWLVRQADCPLCKQPVACGARAV